MTDNLIAELRRSPDADLRRLGQALAPLSPRRDTGRRGPRASEALAAFLAAGPANDLATALRAEPVPEPDLVVQLGTPAKQPGRRKRLLGATLLGGLFGKAVLGATAVLAAGAALAAATGPIGNDTVVVTPSTPTVTTAPAATPATVTDDGHEGRAHAGVGDEARPTPVHRTATSAATARAEQPARSGALTQDAAPATRDDKSGPSSASDGGSAREETAEPGDSEGDGGGDAEEFSGSHEQQDAAGRSGDGDGTDSSSDSDGTDSSSDSDASDY